MAGLPLYQVDAFADRPFRGNPAAVCLLNGKERQADWMQAVAQEMNLAETAFVAPRPDGNGYDLRWFTPAIEVDLCGHATLAAAHVLWETGTLAYDKPARFHTRSGWLTCERQNGTESANGLIVMDFPAEPERETEIPTGLAEALGARPLYAGRNRMDLLLELDNPAELRGLTPDFGNVRRSLTANGLNYRGVIVTARSDQPEYDFLSRCFYSPAGIDEDPVTGSAHCCLGPHWQTRLGKNTFMAFQASRRGGVVQVTVQGDRVLLGGQAVTVLRGELLSQGLGDRV